MNVNDKNHSLLIKVLQWLSSIDINESMNHYLSRYSNLNPYLEAVKAECEKKKGILAEAESADPPMLIELLKWISMNNMAEDIKEDFRGDELYFYFLGIMEQIEENPDDVIIDYRDDRFNELLNQYYSRWRNTERELGRKGTKADFEQALLMSHTGYHRMSTQDHGRGQSHHDPLWRLCFICQLNLMEANELFFAAGQPFIIVDERDSVLADCLDCRELLYQQEYYQEYIDQQLARVGCEPLFGIEAAGPGRPQKR